MLTDDEDDPKYIPRPILLITGATGSVGFGICLRLLYQLSQPIQTDLSAEIHDQFEFENRRTTYNSNLIAEEDHQSVYATPNGLTLLIGCRSELKFRSTKLELENGLRSIIKKENQPDHLDLKYSYIDRLTGQVETINFYDYRTAWLDRLKIDWIPLDLYRAQTVIESIKLINHRYGYLSHLILNAGGGPFVGIDWIGLIKAMIRNFSDALIHPDYLVEASNVKETIDGLPETWQLNVFSHYLLARESLPLLSKGSKKFPNQVRILWTSSLDGRSIYFNRKDLECHQPNSNAYQSTKYQSELVGQGFQQIIVKHGLNRQIISLVAHPGVVAGNMFLPIIGKIMDRMMIWTFYFARLILGSPHHLVEAYLAGLVWTKLCLSERVDYGGNHNSKNLNNVNSHGDSNDQIKREPSPLPHDHRFIRFGARCDRWGNPFVVQESFESDNSQSNDRLIDQRLVIDHCDQRANALLRLWASSNSL